MSRRHDRTDLAPTERAVLVTGGAGFIGRGVVARCLAAGHPVAVLDNLCVGTRDNLEPFLDRIVLHEADILDAERLDAAMTETAPAIVFHLAAHHYIPYCDAHPRETLRVNVEGTHAVLASAARHGADVAVLASSGAFYPSRSEVLDEDLAPAPSDVYGLSKLLAEQVARFLTETTTLRVVAARLFNTYGPYETNPHLIPHIVDSIREAPRVRLGNVHTKRDYIYVEDVAELLYHSGVRSREPWTVVNVGTGREYSARDVVAALEALLRRPIEIEIDQSRVRTVDKEHQRADTRRLEALTGMRPRHSLAEGLARLARHEGL